MRIFLATVFHMLLGHVYIFVMCLWHHLSTFQSGYLWFNYWVAGLKSFIRYMYCKYFLPVCGLPMHLLNGIFWEVEVFNFDKVHLSIFSFIINIFCVLSKIFADSKVRQIFLYIFRTLSVGDGLLAPWSLPGPPVLKQLMRMVTVVPGQGGQF